MIENKYIALIDNYMGESDGALCSILAMQISNSLEGFLVDDSEMLKLFNGSKQVFLPRLRQRNFVEGQIITFILKEVMDSDKSPRVHYSEVSSTKTSICIELNHIPVDKLFLDIQILQNVISEKFTGAESRFYISDGLGVYGEFKFDKGKVVPNIGINVNKFNNRDCLKIDYPNQENDDVTLLLFVPKKVATTLDCSTDIQLIERLKTIIHKTKVSDDTRRYINHIKAIISEEDTSELELAKIKKAISLLNHVDLLFDQFDILRSNSRFWSRVFDNSIMQFEEKLTKEFLENNKQKLESLLNVEKGELHTIQTEILRLETVLKDQENSSLENEVVLKSLSRDIEILEMKKDELILLIQIQSKLPVQTSVSHHLPVPTFEIQYSENSNENFYDKNLNEFLEDIEEVIGLSIPEEDLLLNIIQVELNNKNFFKCEDIQGLLSLIHLLGNSIIYFNSVEADWIKFEKLYNQGLSEAVKTAVNEPNKSVYFILQDYNLSSPECYAKPLIDLSRGLRKFLPGSKIRLPQNLRIIFCPLELDIDDFGFEINEMTLANWENLFPPKLDYSKMKLNKAVNLEAR